MSYWTQVNGSIRFDSLPFTDGGFDTDFGNTCTFDSSDEEWSNCTVPLGSEGSLQYKFVPYENDDHSITCGSLAIWGDLRGFEEEEHPKIIEWLNDISKNRIVRSGVCTINGKVYLYDEHSEGKGWTEYKKLMVKEKLRDE